MKRAKLSSLALLGRWHVALPFQSDAYRNQTPRAVPSGWISCERFDERCGNRVSATYMMTPEHKMSRGCPQVAKEVAEKLRGLAM